MVFSLSEYRIMSKKNTIFCDIDGTLFEYRAFATYRQTFPVTISSVVAYLNQAFDKGHYVVLTTARPEYLRFHTMKELDSVGIQYHQLIMGIARGARILINDNEPGAQCRAYALGLERDKGLSEEDERKLEMWTREI